jgi:hypothetical protein
MAKVCGRCHTSKAESEFFKNIRKPDGLDIYCKSCDYVRRQKYRRLTDQDRLQKKIAAVQKKREKSKEYREKNQDYCIAATKSWYEKNKEVCKVKNKEYKINNREKSAAAASARRLKIKGASISLSKPYKVEIEGLYLFAKLFGGHVDHIVPLNNKNVCGLHVPWNMEIISPIENMSKQGKFDVYSYPKQGVVAFG